MKNIFFYISFALLLASSIISCSSANLPFLEGKYIFWLFWMCVFTIGFALNYNRKSLIINCFDAAFLLPAAYGTIHFVLFSQSTLYNCDVWNYIGYFALYILLRHHCASLVIIKKVVHILISFCCGIAILNLVLMFLQWKHWITSPNQFFATTGMFFSRNQLGIFLSIGCLSTLFLWKNATALWFKIVLGVCGFVIFIGLLISESRGAFISLLAAIVYFLYISNVKTKALHGWKMYLGIGVLLASSFYFINIISKNKTESTSGRLFTNKQVVKQIAKRPHGYGLNSFSLEYNKAKASYFEKNSKWEEMKNAGYVYKANNDFLELTFELGLAWMVLFLFFIALLFLAKSDYIETQIGKTILLCLLLCSLTTSIITTPIFILIACSSSVIIITTTAPQVIYEFKSSGILKYIRIVLCFSFAFLLISRIHAEITLFKLYKNKIYLKGENQLQGYISKIENTGEEFFMGGLTLIKNGYVNDGFLYLEISYERSGKPSIGRILANGLQQQKKYVQAEKIFLYNKNVEPYRYEARMDLLNLFLETKQFSKAKVIATEIIQLPVKIPSPLIVEYKKNATAYLKEFETKK